MSNGLAIIGMACRLPGAPTAQALWSLLRDGIDAVGEPPPSRGLGPDRCGLLEDVEAFDADHFRISPSEAAAMDPQQRLALELSWEGLEDASVVPDGPTAESAGVFFGVMTADYADLISGAGQEAISHYTLTGLGRCLIANRVSYALGMSGPSLTIDTGQSSSLVAVHLACQSLDRGECPIAIAGGVNLILSPLSGAMTTAFGAASPRGRCAPFDERADGTVRGEGGGVVVLKPLEDAIAHGDRIYALVRGSALGTASGDRGLGVPSVAGQRRVMQAALGCAGVAARDVQYVELHGTGTRVGDPIEARALGAVYGRGRPEHERLAVGSIKSNVGHLEGAAGIAGLLKATLCVSRGELVASLHFTHPNPDIALDELGIRVAVRHERWPLCKGLRHAGVSAFGMGGANCHVILEQPPAPVEIPARATPQWSPSLVVSARSEAGLRAQAARLAAWLAEVPDLSLHDVAWSLLSGRAQLERRAAVEAVDREHAVDALRALSDGRPAPGVTVGTARAGDVVFVFPGQGAQWDGMAAELLGAAPVFAEAMHACDEALRPFVDWSLLETLTAAEAASSLERVDVIQPALFSIMVSLAALWRSYGVEPAAVVGHSQGEIAAAHVAGALSLEDAARVVALRSKAVADELAGKGGMASVALSVTDLEPRIEAWGDRLSVAAVNAPAATVVSGEVAALEELLAGLEADGVWARRIPVDYASHTRAVERLEGRLLGDLAPIRPRAGSTEFFSTVEGEVIDTSRLGPAYWYKGLRERVRFAQATRALLESGAAIFVEMSPHPVLTISVQDTIDDAGGRKRASVIGSLRRGDGGFSRFAASLAEAHARGCRVDWEAVFAGCGSRRVELPMRAFQRERFWFNHDVTPEATSPAVAEVALASIPQADRYAAALMLVLKQVASVQGRPAGAVGADRTFKELGFDSVIGVALRDALAQSAGVHLPSTLIFDHPTPAAVAALLVREVTPESGAVAAMDEETGSQVGALAAIDEMSLEDLVAMSFETAETFGRNGMP